MSVVCFFFVSLWLYYYLSPVFFSKTSRVIHSHHDKRRALSTIRYYTQQCFPSIKDLTFASALSHAVFSYRAERSGKRSLYVYTLRNNRVEHKAPAGIDSPDIYNLDRE
jgi:hypothetical protein